MALTDILIGELDSQEMELEIPLGTLNSPVDILLESNSRTGNVEAELILFPESSHVFIL